MQHTYQHRVQNPTTNAHCLNNKLPEALCYSWKNRYQKSRGQQNIPANDWNYSAPWDPLQMVADGLISHFRLIHTDATYLQRCGCHLTVSHWPHWRCLYSQSPMWRYPADSTEVARSIGGDDPLDNSVSLTKLLYEWNRIRKMWSE